MQTTRKQPTQTQGGAQKEGQTHTVTLIIRLLPRFFPPVMGKFTKLWHTKSFLIDEILPNDVAVNRIFSQCASLLPDGRHTD